MTKVCIALSGALLAATAISAPSRADTATAKQVADLGIKFGTSMLHAYAISNDKNLPPLPKDASLEQRAVHQTLSEWKRAKADMNGDLAYQRTASDFYIAKTTLVLGSTGVGAVPAIVAGAAAKAVMDHVFEAKQKEIDGTLKKLLIDKKGELLAELELDNWEELKGLSPAQIRDKLDGSVAIGRAISEAVGDDETGQAMRQDFLNQSAQAIDSYTLNELTEQAADIANVEQGLADLKKDFTTFKTNTLNALDKHEAAINKLNTAVGELGERVSGIDERLAVQERDGAIVADFAFGQMTSAQKAAALDAGFMGERFTGPGGAELRAELIEQFKAEAQIEEIKTEVQRTVQGLTDVATIANNLGVDIPGLGDAVELGSTAFDAFAAFSTGNYLGAVAQVSGLFATQTDPDQARFEAMMGYMKQQFEVVNKKLDEVISLQKETLARLDDLSRQIQDGFEATNEHLARMDFELKSLASLARTDFQDDWGSCWTVYSQVTAGDPYGVVARGDFSSHEQMMDAVADVGDAVKACRTIADQRLPTLGAPMYFGNFLNLRYAIQNTPDQETGFQATETKEKVFRRSDLEAFIQEIHEPSLVFALDLLAKHKQPPVRGFAMLAAPAVTVTEAEARLDTLDPNTACGSGGTLLLRLQQLLCGTGGAGSDSDADDRAVRLLENPLALGFAINLTDWLLVASRLIDLRDQVEDEWLSTPEAMLAYAATNKPAGGKRVLQATQRMLDVAIASYALLSGDLTARAVLDALTAPALTDANAEALRQQAFDRAAVLFEADQNLAANVTMMYLHERFLETQGKTVAETPGASLAGR